MAEIIDVKANDNVVEITDKIVEECAIFVSNGGAITEWCVSNKINYGSFMSEIRKRGSFTRTLYEATRAREEWLKESLVKLMREITEGNPQNCFDKNGNYLGINDIPPATANIIKKLKVRLVPNYEKDEDGNDRPPDEVLEVEFYDKQKSIDQIGKYIQMFVDRVDVHHKITLEETVTRSYEKDILDKQQGNIIDATARATSGNSLLDSALQKKSD